MVDCHVVNLSGLLLAMTLYFTLSSLGFAEESRENCGAFIFSPCRRPPLRGDDIYYM